MKSKRRKNAKKKQIASSAEINLRSRIRQRRAETLIIARRMRHIVMDDRAQGRTDPMLDYNEGFAFGIRSSARILREIERSL